MLFTDPFICHKSHPTVVIRTIPQAGFRLIVTGNSISRNRAEPFTAFSVYHLFFDEVPRMYGTVQVRYITC